MKSKFVKYLVIVALVIVAVICVDKAVGKVLDYLYDSIPVTVDSGKRNFALRELESDVVVVGSSRAAHHYVSTKIADSLAMTTYNVGLDGCFYLDNCFMMHSILNRYSPKMVFLEIDGGALFDDTRNPLEGLYHYYGKADYAKNIIDHEEGKITGVKLMSSLYRHNANSFKTISYGIKGLRSKVKDPLLGYNPIPFKNKLTELRLENNSNNEPQGVLSEWKIAMLDDLLALAKEKNVALILISSPVFKACPNNHRNISQDKIAELANRYNFEYWDYSANALFLDHPEWFNDAAHLNERGADCFTDMVIERIHKSHQSVAINN